MRLLLFFLLAATLQVQAAAPPWAKTLTSTKFGSFPIVRPLKLHYTLGWNGALHSGDLVFELNKPGSKYHTTQIYGGSSGVAKTLFPYKANFVAYLDKKSLRPLVFVGEETDKREHMRTTNRYKKNSMTSKEVVTAINKKGKDHTRNKSFKWPAQLGPVSAMYFIRSQELKKGDRLVFVMHPFHSPYYCEVTVLGREKHLGLDAIKMDIKMRKISSKFTLKPYKKMKESTLWLSDDIDRIPIELRSKVFVGDVRMTLKSRKLL